MEEHKENEFPVKTDHLCDSSEMGIAMRTHTEKMAELGYVMSVPTKRPKTLWDELRDESHAIPSFSTVFGLLV